MAERVTAVGATTSLADRKRRAGQRLMIGLAGPAVTDDLRQLVRELQPAGFVLFARNVVEPAQVAELNRELRSLVDPGFPALCAVDQEGGRVQRVREPATRWPAMRAVGRAGGLTAEVARAMALELRALGFDLNFAPVADVDSNPANPVIGDRAFAARANEVADHVSRFVRAHQAAGMIACAKHFPGHGDTALDSHHDLPLVEREDGDLRHLELVPFRAAVDAGVGTVMTAHVVYPAWDEDRPATLSARIVGPILRGEMGFSGVVFSDDLDMKAIAGRWSPREQVAHCTAAGVDVLLACKDTELQLALFQELVYAQEREPGLQDATKDAVSRVAALRERFLLGRPSAPPLSVLGTPDHKALADRVAERGAA